MINKKNNFIHILTILGLFLAPASAFAFIPPPQPGVISTPLSVVTGNVIDVVLSVMWMVAVAYVVIMFIIAGFKFLSAQGNPTQIAEARMAVIWGIAGAIVIILSWSIITIVKGTFGL